MSIKKEKIPIVRFRDFSEPWIKNQLSEVAEFSKGRGYSKKNLQSHGTPIILYGRLYTNYESVISNVETYANLEENSVVSEGGEVIIPASGESADDISRASCVIDRGIILGGDLNIVRPHEYLNSLFIAMTLSNGSQQRELSKRAQGKSVVHLHNSDLKAIKLFYPSFEEQSAIGSLFRTLDDLLASYKENLANYQSLKATMLSKMFPKAGQTVPEIRLDGFESGWEEKEFSKLVKRVTQSSDSDSLPKVEFEDIISGQGRLNKDISSKFDNRKGIHFKPGYTLYGKLRPYLNNWLLPKFEGVALGDFWVFDPNGNDSNFIYYLVQSSRYQKVANDTSGTKMPRSDWKSVSSTVFAIPQTIAEQQAVGAYFSNLDNLIATHQEKISQLETLKKKLLQDMFI
jgi:type I restriction enzyme S subunit